MKKNYTFDDYTEIVRRLRAPGGCPWDQAQTHESLKNCMIHETAEAMAAIDVWQKTGDPSNLCEELGDMLLQVVLQSQIASEEGLFDISDVLRAASEKMIRRHPHVFAGQTTLPDWEELKKAERSGVPKNVERAKKEALRQTYQEIAQHIQELLQAKPAQGG